MPDPQIPQQDFAPTPPPVVPPPAFVPPAASVAPPPPPPPPPPLAPAPYESGGTSKLKIGLVVLLVVAILGLLIFFLKPTLPSFIPFFGASNEPITIKYWGLWESEAVMKPLIDEYQTSHPKVTIQYEKRTPTQYRETLLARSGEGAGPDIFRWHNTWLPEIRDELAEVPTTTYSATEMGTVFYPTVAADVGSNGKYYGIPLMYDGLAMIYNEDLLKAAGFASPPQTWIDLRQNYAAKLTTYNKDGSISVSGVALGTSTNVEHFSDILGLLMLQNGTKMIDNGQVAFDKTVGSDGRNFGADALDFYTIFAKKNFSDKGPIWSDTLPSSIEAFATGKVAIVFAPSYRIFDILNLMAQSGKTFTVKVANMPQAVPVGQKPPINWASYWVEGVSKRSKNQAVAWDFLKFLSSKDSLTKLHTEQAKTRPFGELPSRVDLSDSFAANKYIAPYLDEAKTATSWYLASSTYDRGLDDGIITYFSDAVTSVLQKNVPADKALTTAAQGASQVLSRYGLVTTNPTPSQ